MPDHIAHGTERFIAAGDQIRAERVAARHRRAGELRIREQTQIIEALLAHLEEHNLEGQRRVDRAVRRRLREVEAALGLAFPRRVVRARNTARMHGALMDWMESTMKRSISPEEQPIDDGEPA